MKNASASALTAFVVASIVGTILKFLEKKGVIESRRDWAPLAAFSSGISVLALGWRNEEKGMIISGSILSTMSAVGFAKKQRKARASR
ncbi:MAG: hypothetical protein SWK76_10400 [Actinomycetota bacterium]|nr:hypothetical protein [Actinomycetota bacterium]